MAKYWPKKKKSYKEQSATLIQKRIRGMLGRMKAREKRSQKALREYEETHPPIATYMRPNVVRHQAAGSGEPLPYSNVHVTARNPLPGHPNMGRLGRRARNTGTSNWFWSEL